MLKISCMIGALLPAIVGAGSLEDYSCSFCTTSVERASSLGGPLLDGCKSLYPDDICLWTFKNKDFGASTCQLKSPDDARQLCMEHSLCHDLNGESWRQTNSSSYKASSSTPLDIRVSKAYGSRGYDKVRVSVISETAIDSELFSYSEPFKYRWTQYYLNTGIVSVTPGSTTSLTIQDEHFDIYVPREGDGVRGIVFGDPCFTSEFITCVYEKPFDMFNRSVQILNAIFGHDDVHFLNILGDNFYDQKGDNTGDWFNALSKSTKTKVLGSIPGNHDFWINASPKLWTPKDQLGNGFMQFYGQDVAASVEDDLSPYDFRNDPDSEGTNAENLPPGSNFFYYNQLGNIGFIGYSGAHKYDDMVPYFEEACSWASQTNSIKVLLLEGHWNSDGDGCDADMTVPEVYANIAALPACQPVAAKMRYLLGHKHCNEIVEADVGFMVGGWGMSDYACGGSFGLPIIDSNGGKLRVMYLPLQQAAPQKEVYDHFDEVLACIEVHGISGCYQYAEEWATIPIM